MSSSSGSERKHGWGWGQQEYESGYIQPVANALTARMHKGINTTCDEGQTLVAQALTASRSSTQCPNEDTTLVPVAFDTTQITHPENRSNPQPGDACHPLTAVGYPPAIAFNWQNAGGYGEANEGLGITEEATGPLQRCQTPAVAITSKGNGEAYESGVTNSLCSAGGGQAGQGYMAARVGHQVRRLTPRECERLQGFPDDWTLVPYRNKPAADGPRYKALGNSMAVPVMAWIGRRIAAVEEIVSQEAAA